MELQLGFVIFVIFDWNGKLYLNLNVGFEWYAVTYECIRRWMLVLMVYVMVIWMNVMYWDLTCEVWMLYVIESNDWIEM